MTFTKPASRRNTEMLNRRQKLMTIAQYRALPPLYSTDGQGMQAVAQVKFFCGAFTWFATEFDGESGQFFGLVYNANMADQLPTGELGYFSADELKAAAATVNCVNSAGRSIGSFATPVERDLHFKPKPLAEAVAELTGRPIEADAEPAEELAEAAGIVGDASVVADTFEADDAGEAAATADQWQSEIAERLAEPTSEPAAKAQWAGAMADIAAALGLSNFAEDCRQHAADYQAAAVLGCDAEPADAEAIADAEAFADRCEAEAEPADNSPRSFSDGWQDIFGKRQ